MHVSYKLTVRNKVRIVKSIKSDLQPNQNLFRHQISFLIYVLLVGAGHYSSFM